MRIPVKLRQLWANQTINYSLLIFVTFMGVVLPCWYFEQHTHITTLILGVIAAALAESDDNFTGRMKAILITLICFAIATFSIEILFPIPWLFAIGLFSSTFGFIILGALGPRYASIAFGSLLIAIYTMLGVHLSTNIWFQPLLLLMGSAWFFFMSNLWRAFWPSQPVQQNLAFVFNQLANYLDAKSQRFYPDTNASTQQSDLHLTRLNGATVNALNSCKATLLNRSKRGHVDVQSDRFLNIYFLVQDIHERVSSSHYRYQDLSQDFERADILFRCEHLLQSQAKACRAIAESIQLGLEYEHDPHSMQSLEQLQLSFEYLTQQNKPHWQQSLHQLHFLITNLTKVENQLGNISNPDAMEENTLQDTNPHTMKAMWSKVVANLTPDSMLFRHAVRMSLALTLGYGVIQLLQLERGYWILLTTLFVCQPNFSATRQKLVARVIGTLVGLVVGVILLILFPSQQSQLAFIVFSGVMFFALRINDYRAATGFITLLVLFCFNQLGEGYAVILPRLADTIIGCILAVGAVMLILPDWQAKRLSKVMAGAIQANKQYLGHIVAQYRVGKKDSLAYRIARRNAHNQDANLTTAISNMLTEPDRYRIAVDESFRFLTLNHALLSYISALGAHRRCLEDQDSYQLILDLHGVIHRQLNNLYHHLNHSIDEIDDSLLFNSIQQRLDNWHAHNLDCTNLVMQQLDLIYQMLPELSELSLQISLQTQSNNSVEYKNAQLSSNKNQ